MASRLSNRFIGILFLLLLLPNFAHAQGIFNTSIQENISWVVTWAIAAMNLGIWIVFIILNQLLDTSVFLSPGMLDILNKVWVLSRDLMNIIFAFVLIGAAVYTTVTAKREMIKELLPKFIMAVVLVNFSWFIPRVIIDVGNVAAATVFDIPSLIGKTNVPCKYHSSVQLSSQGGTISCPAVQPPTTPPQYNCDCAAVIDAKFFLTDADAATLLPTDGWNPILGNTLYVKLTALDKLANTAPSSVVLNGLIINHARLAGLATVPPSVNTTEIQAFIMFLLQEAMVLILHVALFFPLAAMALAFAIRIPVLWLTIAFMPFMVLKFVVPEKFTGEYPQKIWDNFLKAAFLPAIVGAPLTVGFVMINAGQQAGVLLNMQGIQLPLTANISDILELLWLVMTLGIIWVGVFSSLEKMGVMGMGSKMIKGAGESLGKLAVKAPLSAAVIPGTGISALSMGRTFNPAAMNGTMNNSDNWEDFTKRLRNNLKSGGGTTPEKRGQEMAKNPQQIDDLNKKLTALTAAINGGNAGEKARIEGELARDHGVHNDGDLQTLITEMKNAKADAGKTAESEKQMNELKTARKAHP